MDAEYLFRQSMFLRLGDRTVEMATAVPSDSCKPFICAGGTVYGIPCFNTP